MLQHRSSPPILNVDLIATHSRYRLANRNDLLVTFARQADLQPAQPPHAAQECVQKLMLDAHLSRAVQHRNAVRLDVAEPAPAQVFAAQRPERACGVVQMQNPVAQFQRCEVAVCKLGKKPGVSSRRMG